MSYASRVTNRNEIRINSTSQNRLQIFLGRLRTLCSCFKKQEDNVLPLVHAVDSVRLVYMRRIEEASLLNLRRQQNQNIEGINEGTQTRTVRHRRMRQELATIKALEKALKEYESKHKTIISSTRMPESISFDKTQQISRASQTDTAEVLEELLKAVNEIKIKDSINNSEVIKHVTLYNSDEDDGNKSSDVKAETSDKDLNKNSPDNIKDGLDSSKTTLQTI